MRCGHPYENRRKTDDGLVKCMKCGSTFKQVVRAKKVYHGTESGYAKHKRLKKGYWKWPACDKCQEANRVAQKDYSQRPAHMDRVRDRNAAANKALQRLRRRYPVDYAKFYAEELLMLEEGADAIRRLEVEVTALLRQGGQGNRTLEACEIALRRCVSGRWATIEEQERWGRIQELRARKAELEQRPAPAAPVVSS